MAEKNDPKSLDYILEHANVYLESQGEEFKSSYLYTLVKGVVDASKVKGALEKNPELVEQLKDAFEAEEEEGSVLERLVKSVTPAQVSYIACLLEGQAELKNMGPIARYVGRFLIQKALNEQLEHYKKKA